MKRKKKGIEEAERFSVSLITEGTVAIVRGWRRSSWKYISCEKRKFKLLGKRKQFGERNGIVIKLSGKTC